jgi:hypothetical protein
VVVILLAKSVKSTVNWLRAMMQSPQNKYGLRVLVMLKQQSTGHKAVTILTKPVMSIELSEACRSTENGSV